MREYSHGSYYVNGKDSTGNPDEIKRKEELNDLKFIDVHLSVKVAIEWFLSKLLFKDNLKRVVYSSSDIAFRKRIEYLDSKTEYDENSTITPEGLDLPFASYINSGDPEPDDRPAAASAAQSIIGEWDEDFETSVRSLAIKQSYKATIFFARRDEVRLAQQLLLWEKEPKFPVRMYHTIKWRGCNLTIPINISIESINTSPDYQESDWLTKNRIFPIEVEMTVRTYQILVSSIENLYQLPIRFSNVIDDYDEFDPPAEYITEQVILDWANEKFDIDTNTDNVDFDSADIKALLMSPFYFNQKGKDLSEVPNKIDKDENDESIHVGTSDLERFANLPNEYTTDIIQGYFQTDSSAVLNYIRYNEHKSTPTEACIEFMLKPSTFKYFEYLELSIPLKEKVRVTDCKQREAKIGGLVQNSEYKVTATVHALDGSIKTYFLEIHTPIDNSPKNPDKTPTPEKINKTPGLIGMRLF